MSRLSRLLSAIALLASAIAMLFRKQAEHAQEEAERQTERAVRAESMVNQQQKLNRTLTELEQQHRQEQRDEQASLDAGARNHFERDR